MNAFEKLERLPVTRLGEGRLQLWGRRAIEYARGLNPWFWLIVIIPCSLAAVYLFFVASDLYMSEARFIVRAPGRQTGMLGSILQNSGLQNIVTSSGGTGQSPDSYAVESYITSRDAVRDLQNSNRLRNVFARPEGDLLTRFPTVLTGNSFEALYRHYQYFVDVSVDATSGVTTLQVLSYRPTDSYAIASALLRYSERLVNKLNARAEGDTISQARREIDEAERTLGVVQSKLTAYRTSTQILDPALTSTSIYKTWGDVMSTRMITASQIGEMTKDSPDNPAIPALKARLSALDIQLNQIMGQVAGEANSVAGKMGEYERLKLDEDMAEKMLTSASEALASARIDARQQHLYVEHIAEPSVPDYPLYPHRLLWFLCVVAACFTMYGVAWLLIAGIREHTDA